MPRYFALVPAAGSGSRIGQANSKQYLPLAGRPMIAHSVKTLSGEGLIRTVFVVLARDDDQWATHNWSAFGDKVVSLYCGGATRAESVANGLQAMSDHVQADDWMLVHDAARPCLTASNLKKLITEVGDDPVGGILALPVSDTLKRADAEDRIEATMSREKLWQAQTPQMFRHGMLLNALARHTDVTDEAGAIEALGYRPRLVAGDTCNIKVTYPQDLSLAELILKGRSAL